MTNEQTLSNFMRLHYSDIALAALLAHAEDGKLFFDSCCCFIGIPLAIAAGAVLHGRCGAEDDCNGPQWANRARLAMPSADAAEDAFLELGVFDDRRRELIIPLIHAEMERRERSRSESSELQAVAV
jgi:hypothetical protein